jgi:hypothetical protein
VHIALLMLWYARAPGRSERLPYELIELMLRFTCILPVKTQANTAAQACSENTVTEASMLDDKVDASNSCCCCCVS